MLTHVNKNQIVALEILLEISNSPFLLKPTDISQILLLGPRRSSLFNIPAHPLLLQVPSQHDLPMSESNFLEKGMLLPSALFSKVLRSITATNPYRRGAPR
ncbi:hypothetical protein NPIL_316551 [Nephila pilipes]|uniref:Uncharacterized protein n=1 Tax=Nephila pilipes TaxID=299642 RepID=A0A8X6QHG7_NEPPI|nr:hypothetical protein NPIL_316551 [Nephila pilipes]